MKIGDSVMPIIGGFKWQMGTVEEVEDRQNGTIKVRFPHEINNLGTVGLYFRDELTHAYRDTTPCNYCKGPGDCFVCGGSGLSQAPVPKS